jgi:hypothetical protein
MAQKSNSTTVSIGPTLSDPLQIYRDAIMLLSVRDRQIKKMAMLLVLRSNSSSLNRQ